MNTAPKTTDRLTGSRSRIVFQSTFTAMLDEGRASEHPLALALFDIDRFLSINENYGHSAGDQVLVAIADIVRQHCGDGIVFRIGGDEFAILFAGWEREQAFLAMEEIRRTVAQHKLQTTEGETVENISISGGVAAFPVDGRTQVELVRKADQALYRAKVAGRNQIRLAFEEKMVPKTTHFTQTQLERLSKLAAERQTSEADLLREAMDDLLTKYGVNDILS